MSSSFCLYRYSQTEYKSRGNSPPASKTILETPGVEQGGRQLDRKTYAKAFCPRHQAKGENQNGWAEKSANIDSLRPTPQYFLHQETYEEKIARTPHITRS